MDEHAAGSGLTPHEAFRQAVARLGGQSATARLLDVSQQAISAALTKGRACSAEWVLKLAAASQLTTHDLRPDLYPDDPAAPFQPPASGEMEAAQ